MRISDWSSDVCSSDLVAPLVRAGLLPPDWPYICHAVSGYSGGGKALIERFEQDRDIAWRGYALTLGHKHVPDMQEIGRASCRERVCKYVYISVVGASL